jgi:Trypsin/Bacterial Ig domain
MRLVSGIPVPAILSGALALAISAGCASDVPASLPQPVAPAATPIVNGSKDTEDPAVVFISWPGYSCTGTLVSKTVVLTARHCVLDVAQGAHRVGFGNGWDGNFNFISTTGYEFIPGSNADLSNDLAVLFLAVPAPDGIAPKPVNAASLANHIGESVRIVGFGITDSGQNDSGVKRQGTTTLSRVESTLMYHTVNPSGTCEGDSGGPQFMTIGGTEFLAGVTSFGSSTGCTFGEHGAVRTDAFLDWLGQYFDTQFDKVPPTVTITSPADGATVAAGFKVLVDAADDRKVQRVTLNIDGTNVDNDLSMPYELQPTANLAAGTHNLEVIAYDDFENAGHATMTVTVAPSCASNDDCDDGKECAQGVCVGAIGADCTTSGDCGSGQCLHEAKDSFCTINCASSDECPSGFACAASDLSPATKCRPSEGGGCTVAVGRGERLPLLAAGAMLLVLLSASRRRRRS